MMHRKRIHCFGSSCQLTIDTLPAEADALVSIATAELSRLEHKFSAFNAGSLISKINQSAGTGCYTALDPEALSLFDFVSALWEESSHIFDPTTRLLLNCYDDDGRLKATDSQVKAMLHLVGLVPVGADSTGRSASPEGHATLDLNSCIRPYAIDSVRRKLIKEGVENAMIEMAQDAVTIGKQFDGANWLLGLRHPFWKSHRH